MNKSIISLICLLFNCFHGICQGNIHLFIIADDAQCISCTTDFDNIKKTGRIISESLNLPLKIYPFLSKQLNEENIKNEVNNLRVNKHDKVIFYSSVHAACKDEKERVIIKDIQKWATIDLESIYDALIKKGAQLTLLLIDGCVNEPGNKSKEDEVSFEDVNKKNIRDLFSCQGVLDVKSSSCGQESYGHIENGGFFTISFLNTFFRDTNNWEILKKLVIEKTTKLASTTKGKKQIPSFDKLPICN